MKSWQKFKLFFANLLHKKSVLVIDRATWGRGDGYSDSQLLRIRDGKRCCLGFYCQFLGVPDQDMLDVGQPCILPYSLQKQYGILDSWLFMSATKASPNSIPSEDLQLLIRYNDRKIGAPCTTKDITLMTEKYREKKIRDIFYKNNVKVTFIN